MEANTASTQGHFEMGRGSDKAGAGMKSIVLSRDASVVQT